jgi:clusterin-associated protein 1
LLVYGLKRADPTFAYPYEITSEADRVALIKAICNHAQSRLHLKLNPKRLYAAEQPSVHELCKFAKMLGDASRANPSSISAAPTEDVPHPEAKETRQMASDITQDGARLSDILEAERDVRASRYAALGIPMEPELAEQVLTQKIRESRDETATLQQKLQEYQQDRSSLTERIAKKKEELDRSKNRLQAWRAMRFVS